MGNKFYRSAVFDYRSKRYLRHFMTEQISQFDFVSKLSYSKCKVVESLTKNFNYFNNQDKFYLVIPK